MTIKYGSRWIGHMVTDCSGLLRWALKQLGENIVHHARYQYTDYCHNKGKLINGLREDGSPILPGTAVFLQGSEEHIHHVGVYVGNNTCIEAKGTQYGVVTSAPDHWDHWGELIMVDYSDAAELEGGDVPELPSDVLFRAEVNNPNTWLNVRSGPGQNYPLRFQVHKGATVDVLALDEKYWQIRYGSQIGWACAEFLKPLNDEETPPEIVPDEPVEPEEPELPEMPEQPEIVVDGDVINELIDIKIRLDKLIDRLGGYVG